ncbi:MAG: thiamine-phosphate kinase [Burkholderiales bacterium]|nr:thiamine-phosphate kinase [Burkholderiales bacterium]
MGEFELIRHYFQRAGANPPGVVLGVGDDCALLQPEPGQRLAVSTDMLVEGRHFFADVDPVALGHKALAVNLSDLAAMGASPLGCTLALALPRADEAWLAGFSRGLFALADAAACPLVGGDTTKGPLNLCITVFGQVPPGQELRRSGARAGDEVWVSGQLGDARLALDALLGEIELAPEVLARARQRLERPTPRLALGLALRGIASAAADVSDGLCGDLGHILAASGVGAKLAADALLASSAISADLRALPREHALRCALAGGDDYELIFTAPAGAHDAVLQAARSAATPVSCLGHITAEPGLRWQDACGRPLDLTLASFDHFA